MPAMPTKHRCKASSSGPLGLTLAECEQVYLNPFVVYNRFSNRRRNRKNASQRPITALDLYLLDKSEQELRAMFKTRDLECCKNTWIPTHSLFGLSEGDRLLNKKCNELWLDKFQRKLLHMLASYLSLHSHSVWNDELLDKQLSVKCSWSLKEVVMPVNSFLVGFGEQNLLNNAYN
ncbi:hypothetical protein Ciccas_008287 [Cichlidogyrus casuarinus]|uniref:Uncharacterized protein n=1 Tax=Cichlidogyrus casuarinus TaxID=1844966 RepID=A0ABD2Q0D3_9PLAT